LLELAPTCSPESQFSKFTTKALHLSHAICSPFLGLIFMQRQVLSLQSSACSCVSGACQRTCVVANLQVRSPVFFLRSVRLTQRNVKEFGGSLSGFGLFCSFPLKNLRGAPWGLNMIHCVGFQGADHGDRQRSPHFRSCSDKDHHSDHAQKKHVGACPISCHPAELCWGAVCMD
jgi:hypothetical protein